MIIHTIGTRSYNRNLFIHGVCHRLPVVHGITKCICLRAAAAAARVIAKEDLRESTGGLSTGHQQMCL